MAELKLPILKGLQSAYDAIVTKSPDVIYIMTDTGNMYLGTALLGGKNVSDITIDEETLVLTINYTDDTTGEIDLPLESVFSNVDYDSETKTLTFTLVSGETTQISLSDLIPVTVDTIDTDTSDAAIPNAGAVKSYVQDELTAALVIGEFR